MNTDANSNPENKPPLPNPVHLGGDTCPEMPVDLPDGQGALKEPGVDRLFCVSCGEYTAVPRGHEPNFKCGNCGREQPVPLPAELPAGSHSGWPCPTEPQLPTMGDPADPFFRPQAVDPRDPALEGKPIVPGEIPPSKHSACLHKSLRFGLFCVLKKGHPGDHRCGESNWSDSDSEACNAHNEGARAFCTLLLGHAGPHRSGTISWEDGIAEGSVAAAQAVVEVARHAAQIETGSNVVQVANARPGLTGKFVPRCQSQVSVELGEVRCVLREGHPGQHVNGPFEWGDPSDRLNIRPVCDSICPEAPGLRCSLAAGHKGAHRCAGLRWEINPIESGFDAPQEPDSPIPTTQGRNPGDGLPDLAPIEVQEAARRDARRQERVRALQVVINSLSMENLCDTPDFILAEFLMSALETFSFTVIDRERWYGRPNCGHETFMPMPSPLRGDNIRTDRVVSNAPLELKHAIAEALGYASLCWEPKPTGVFESEKAVAKVEEVWKQVETAFDDLVRQFVDAKGYVVAGPSDDLNEVAKLVEEVAQLREHGQTTGTLDFVNWLKVIDQRARKAARICISGFATGDHKRDQSWIDEAHSIILRELFGYDPILERATGEQMFTKPQANPNNLGELNAEVARLRARLEENDRMREEQTRKIASLRTDCASFKALARDNRAETDTLRRKLHIGCDYSPLEAKQRAEQMHGLLDWIRRNPDLYPNLRDCARAALDGELVLEQLPKVPNDGFPLIEPPAAPENASEHEILSGVFNVLSALESGHCPKCMHNVRVSLEGRACFNCNFEITEEEFANALAECPPLFTKDLEAWEAWKTEFHEFKAREQAAEHEEEQPVSPPGPEDFGGSHPADDNPL